MRHGDVDKMQARLRLERRRVGAMVRHGDADKTQARFRLERHRLRAVRTDGWLGAGVGCLELRVKTNNPEGMAG